MTLLALVCCNPVCGVPFLGYASTKGKTNRYCSVACRHAAKKSEHTDPEIHEIICLMYPVMDTNDLAEFLGWPVRTLRSYTARRRIVKEQQFRDQRIGTTPEQETRIRELYPNHSNKQIAELLGVSVNFIRGQAHRMKLLKSNEWLYAHNLPLIPENPLEREVAQLQKQLTRTILRRERELANEFGPNPKPKRHRKPEERGAYKRRTSLADRAATYLEGRSERSVGRGDQAVEDHERIGAGDR